MIKDILFLIILITACQSPASESQTDEEENVKATEQDTFPRIEVDTAYLMGKFNPATHVDFIRIEAKYTDKDEVYLRKDAYAKFKEMYEAALQDSVKLLIRSATRNFQAQKGIWEAKWKGERILSDGKNAATDYPDPKARALKILEYSSMPGTSRHHWGTDIDLNAFNNKYFESGEGLKIYTWLLENAHKYGFCQPYTAKDYNRPNGYNEEKWHWSYIPVARQLTDQAKATLKNEMIQGFQGAETAPEIDVVNNYILGINADCL